MRAQGLGRFITQAAAQVRALQVAVAVGGGAVQQQAVTPAFGQLLAQARMVERQVHRVARLGVGELEIQLSTGGNAGAGAAQGNARRGEAAQFQPGVVGQVGFAR